MLGLLFWIIKVVVVAILVLGFATILVKVWNELKK